MTILSSYYNITKFKLYKLKLLGQMMYFYIYKFYLALFIMLFTALMDDQQDRGGPRLPLKFLEKIKDFCVWNYPN